MSSAPPQQQPPQQQSPPGLSPAVAAPPGLGGMGGPPGLQQQQQQPNPYAQQMQQQGGQQGGMQGQTQGQAQFPPQPDLSSIGPHTSAAQLAQLLASVGNQGPDLSGAGEFSRGPQHTQMQQQQGGGFGGNGGGWNNGGMSNGGGHGGMGGMGGGMGGGGGATGPVQHPCRMHQQGHCRYGATCRFMHVGPAGSGAGQQQGGGFGGNKFGGGHNAFGGGFGGQGAFGGHGGNGGGYGGNNSFQSRSHDQDQKSEMFNSGAAATFPQAQQQPQQQQAFGGGAAGNPTAALLQTLLLQQQLTASQGLPSNPELDNLVASLTKSAGAAPAAAASSTPAPAAASTSAPADSNLNNEFRQAQQALASLALGGAGAGAAGARPPQQQQPGIGFPSYAQRNAPSAGGFNAGPNYGNKHNQHHGGQSSYGAPSYGQSTFHAGGNFNAGASPAFGGVAHQMRFFSDANNRDPRREVELFGPAHTTTTGINFDKYDDIPVEVTGNDVPGEMKAFSDFDFPDVIRQNIELSKYVKPTPIQKFALPVAFLGRDLMACAQTGSGQTTQEAETLHGGCSLRRSHSFLSLCCFLRQNCCILAAVYCSFDDQRSSGSHGWPGSQQALHARRFDSGADA